MKRFFIILFTTLLISGFAFAQEDDGDEYDDGYVYEANGAGDQFLKFGLGGQAPLNFGGSVRKGNGSLYWGGDIELGYYRFFNSWFGVGGEITLAYNLSVGNKILVMLPITGGVLLQPSIGKFEFPCFFNVGLAYETWQNMNYFPSFTAKASVGAFYRINESFSVGVSGNGLWIPQWFKDSSKNWNGLFADINVTVRYHL